MADIIEIKLSEHILPNYAYPDEIIVYEGDKIKFISLDADFEVEFIDAEEVTDISINPINVTSDSQENEITTAEFIPNGGTCFYRVKIIDEPEKGGPGRAKMIVKAIR